MRKLKMTLALAMTWALPALGLQVASAQPAMAAPSDPPTMTCQDPLTPYLDPDPVCPVVELVIGTVCKTHCQTEADSTGTRETG